MKPKKHELIHWPSAFAFFGIAGCGVCVVICMLLLMCSCSTTKELHEHQTHNIMADTLAKEAKHEGHRSETTRDLDSLVTASIWAVMQEFASTQTEHETTTETLTETIDSLGRVIRQQQKMTDRTVSKQEQQRRQQQLQEMEVRIYETMRRSDSTWNERIAQMESHLRDSLSASLDKQAKVNASPSASPWWQKTWAWIRGILIGIVIGVVMMLTKKYWKKWPS